MILSNIEASLSIIRLLHVARLFTSELAVAETFSIYTFFFYLHKFHSPRADIAQHVAVAGHPQRRARLCYSIVHDALQCLAKCLLCRSKPHSEILLNVSRRGRLFRTFHLSTVETVAVAVRAISNGEVEEMQWQRCQLCVLEDSMLMESFLTNI